MNRFEHFGVPDENILAAQSYPHQYGRQIYSDFVPSRQEVRTLDAGQLNRILNTWMYRSATEIIPSKAQIFEVRSELERRADHDQILAVIETCDRFIAGERQRQ